MPTPRTKAPDQTHQALLPSPALFDLSDASSGREHCLERVALEHLQLAPNARREISQDGIDRLAAMLMRTGQVQPCIGRRPDPDQPRVLVYDGQRRFLAAHASHRLAATNGYEGLHPIQALILILLDHDPTPDERRRIQAQANQHEQLTLHDQQEQFNDCWQARAGLREKDRIAVVCADMGISPLEAHNFKRQLSLPDEIRSRVAEHPKDNQLSVTLTNRLATMNETAPALATAVATRVTTPELHDKAVRDLGAFVHRTLVEDPTIYAVRIDDGVLLDGAELIDRAHQNLTTDDRPAVAKLLKCELNSLDGNLARLAINAKEKALKVPVTSEVRDRARNGRYAYAHNRGRDFAASIWVIDPVFMIDLAHQALTDHNADQPAHEESFFKRAGIDSDELRDAAAADRERAQEWRQRQADATRSNLGLGHDLRAGLMDPNHTQLQALRDIVCHLIARQHRDVIAYGAGWSDPERQQPVADSLRYEPLHPDTVVQAELDRALADRDPLHGIAQLLAPWAAAFVLDPDGVTRTKALGHERMGRKLQDTLPGGPNPLRQAVWEFLRPMLSPNLVDLNRDAFVPDDNTASTVTLDAYRAPSDLADLDLGEQAA